MTSPFPPLIQAFAGGLGSVGANAGSFPLDVIAARIQTRRGRPHGKGSKDPGPIEMLNRIFKKEGFSGLYAGFWSDSLATLISNFIYFYAYSLLRARLLDRKISKSLRRGALPSRPPVQSQHDTPVLLSTGDELLTGFLAGVISRLASTPMNIVTIRLQVERHAEDDDEHHSTILSVMRSIYREEGIAGFWKGFESTVLLCTNPAITLFLFQLFRRLIPHRELTAAQSFVGAATSNAVAVGVLYPLILIKTRIQSARRKGAHKTAIGVAREVVHQKGVVGLYEGLGVQVMKGVLNQGFTMATKQKVEALIMALYLISKRHSA